MESVDVLTPPAFAKSGIVKPKAQAIAEGDWIGTFNLWIIQTIPTPSIVYQIRSPNSTWAPNKLDVTAGGHYQAGESILDGLREVKEELGKDYDKGNLIYLGRKVHISPDIKGNERHNIVEVFLTTDNSPLTSYLLEKTEVYAVCTCPIAELIKVHSQKGYSFTIPILTNTGKTKELSVTKDSFPYNWDNYHYKIALLVDRHVRGEKNLLY